MSEPMNTEQVERLARRIHARECNWDGWVSGYSSADDCWNDPDQANGGHLDAFRQHARQTIEDYEATEDPPAAVILEAAGATSSPEDVAQLLAWLNDLHRSTGA